MKSLQNYFFFIQQYSKQMKNKWFSLILLFFVPLLMLICIVWLVILLISPNKEEPITLAIIDEDQTTESNLFVQLFTLTIADNDYLNITTMDSAEAKQAIKDQKLSSYILFPKGLTEDLFNGEPVLLQQIGNQNSIYESYIINELINNLARYIESAQANILITYQYAEQVNMPKDEFEQFQMEQFMNFTMHSLAKGTLISENKMMNRASSTPQQYFTIAGLFILLSVWLLGLELLLKNNVKPSILIRYRLLGVTELQQVLARMMVILLVILSWTSIVFAVVQHFLQLELLLLDYWRLFSYITLYSFSYLLLVAIIHVIIRSMKLALLVQVIVLFITLFVSGALIPTLYFPLSWQTILPYLLSNNTFSWLIDIAIEGRNFAEYKLLITYCVTLFIGNVLLTKIHERWSR
jgi:ABC-2 type transport system permease protein